MVYSRQLLAAWGGDWTDDLLGSESAAGAADEQFRSAVVAPEGWALLDAFSQMELQLAAIVAQDENMMLAFKEGKDLHTATAEARL